MTGFVHVRALARALMATSGRAVTMRAVPLASVMGIVSAIVFAGHGLRARDVTSLMHGSLAVRAAMWLVWITLATPVVAPAFDAPGTRAMRSIAHSSFALVTMLVALAVIAQAPLVALFARGEGALAATAAAFTAVALCASATSRSIALFAGTCSLVAMDRTPLTFAVAPVLAWLGVRRAWASAFEQHGAMRIVRRAPPAIALALAYVARMVRSARGRLEAAALVVFAGGAALALSLRNDPDARPIQRALVVLAFPVSIACGLLASPAIETEARLLPIVRAARTRTVTLGIAMCLALAAPSTAFAGTASAAAAIASHASHAMTIASIVWAALIASSIAVWARRASRARRSTTFLVGTIAIASAFTFMAAAC